MPYEFKSNGEFIWFAMGQNPNEKWSLAKDQNSIIAIVRIEKMIFEIKKLTEGEMILKVNSLSLFNKKSSKNIA